MKELLSKNFWRDVKQAFDDGRDGSNREVAVVPGPGPEAEGEVSGVLFDMDGVLYDAGRLIDGAAETVRWVQSERVPHLFVTNTTSRARADLVEKLGAFGMTVAEGDILTPAATAAEWLRTQEGAIAAFVRPAARLEFAGLNLLGEDAERGAAFVVIGDLGDGWDYATLNRAFRLLHYNPEAKLVALGMTRYWMAPDGIALDVAPFVAALECASRRKALVFGKPSEAFFRAAADRLGLAPGGLLMIGDDIEADVRGARAAGLKAAVVKTGKFRAADLERGIRPDLVLESVQELEARWPEIQRLRS